MMLTQDHATATTTAYWRFRHLPTKVATLLVRKGVRSWGQIADASDEELLALDMLGPKSLTLIRDEQRVQRLGV